MAVEYGLNEYKCYLCEEEFVDVASATKHLLSKLEEVGKQFQCMKIHKNDTFCTTKFASIKSLRKHMKENKCKLLSNDASQIDNDENSGGECNSLLTEFGALSFQRSTLAEKENASYSLAAHIESFVNKLVISNISHDLVSDIIDYSKELVCKTTTLSKESMRMKSITSTKDAEIILDSTEKFVTSHINVFKTRYKRKKHFANSPKYVAPETLSLGDKETFQYVSILDTLNKLFTSEVFKDMYFTFNGNHQCQKDVYERFCCGRKYKDSDFFQSNNNCIQIQIFYDDVQLTSPLKTRPHKICAIYFIIRNLPPEFTSKLDNMYLVALCDSRIVGKYGCNTAIEHLVREIKILETEGIAIDSNGIDERTVLKGTLIQASFDNLGGNELFGITKCFTSKYCCRICICTKDVCKEKTIEVAAKIRTKLHYIEQIKKINEYQGAKLLPKDFFGYTNYSVLNNLNHFHTIENRSQDIMHDIHEGAMPFVLRKIFKYLKTHEIITEEELELRISAFNYGKLESKNIPSKLCLKKRNLNQNASQMHCLMRHIPFILIDLLKHNDNKKKVLVHKAWPIIEHMLKIDQIVCSTVITEKDLMVLEQFTKDFLELIKKIFGVKLFPKLHFMTHYSNTIRTMGPLRYLQMIRGDAKHQPLVQYAKRCKNYMNICKTLAEKHQEVLAAKWSENTYRDNVKMSKKTLKEKEKNNLINEAKHSQLFLDYFEDISKIMILNYVTINSSYFSKGLFIMYADKMHQIDIILKYNDSFIFLCTKFNTVKFYKFANCYEIINSTETMLIKLDKLVYKTTYEGKVMNGKTQIIAEDLRMIPVYEKYIV